MAPQPIDDIGDDLLQLLLALWVLVSDLCNAVWLLLTQVASGLWTCVEALWALVCDISISIWDLCVFIWDCISQAVSTVWTYFVETFWNEFVAAMTGLTNYVIAHPATAAVMFVIAFIFIPRILNALGARLWYGLDVEHRRSLRDSYATNYQSTSYGGNIPRSSTKNGYYSSGN